MATNCVFESGKVLRLAVASPTKSNDPVVIGDMGGAVAITDYSASDGGATLDFGGVYKLSVKGVNNGGNSAVAVGDALYFVSGDTPVLSKKSSGVFFGYALEVVSGGATTTIQVRSAQARPANGGYFAGGVFVSAETTGTGSAQNVAHGLGSTPSKVVVVPTAFASGVAYSQTMGAHDATNVVVTVPSGSKFQVIAWK